MNPNIQPIDNSAPVHTQEDVSNTSAAQQPLVSWQGREVTLEQSQQTGGGQPSVLEGLENVHIMTHVLSFLRPADIIRSAHASRFFWAAKQLTNVERANTLTAAFGLPRDFSPFTGETPGLPLDESTLSSAVERLIQIEQTLPEEVRRGQNSREQLRKLAQNPTWLGGFLQAAYDNQLLMIFGELANVDPFHQSFAEQVHHVRQWLDTSPSITTLHLKERNLLLVPQEITRLSLLQFLDVSNNQIAALPDLSPLTHLLILNLSQNQLTRLPAMEQLVNLQALNASENQLTELPDLSPLTNLTYLNVSYNQLTELPDLTPLTTLQSLNVEQNRLTRLPGVDQLFNLRSLRIANTLLTEFPSVRQLTELQELNVSDTQISSLPDQLFQLPHMSLIFACRCPNLVIPREQTHLINELRSRHGTVRMRVEDFV